MLVLTAAPFTYAGVEIGFCRCETGELVRLGDTCECDCHEVDEEDCGCVLDCEDGSTFVGLTSLELTTTARIEDRSITEQGLRSAVRDSIRRSGWSVPGVTDDIVEMFVDIETRRIHEACGRMPSGALLGNQRGRPFAVPPTARTSGARRP